MAEFVPLCAVAVVSLSDEEGSDGELVDEVGGEEHGRWVARGCLSSGGLRVFVLDLLVI